MKQKGLFIAIFLSFLYSSKITAQVTIGIGEAPEKGAILQLKNITGMPIGGINATKGLGLSRVALSEPDKLYPMFNVGYSPSENDIHTGLVVYNTTYKGELCPGPYVWDGERWIRLLPGECTYFDVIPDQLTFRKTPQVARSINISSYPAGYTYDFTEKAGNNITWEPIGGFPTDGLSLPSYSFRPITNNTGTQLNSTVVVKATHPNGTILSKEVIIKQLTSDINFSAIPSEDPYAAIGGAGKYLTVDSDVDWEMLSVTDAKSIVSNHDLKQFPVSSGFKYLFDLAPNQTYADRTAAFNIISPDPDFIPQSVSIRQAHIDPLLTVTPSTIDFGTTSVSQNLSLTFNANVNITTDPQYSNVISTPGALSNYVWSNPLVNENQTITLTPNTSFTDPANTIHSTTLNFSTTNPDGAPNVNRSVTLQRTVPAKFTLTNVSPAINSILSSPAQVTFTVQTNAAWSVKDNVGGQTNAPASSYGIKTITYQIGAYTGWATRNVDLQYFDPEQNIWSQLYPYTQLGYTLTYHSGMPTVIIPYQGQDIVFKFQTTTSNPQTRVRALDMTNGGGQIAIANIPASASPAIFNANTLPVPYYERPTVSAGNRTVKFQYEKQSNTWTDIGQIIQEFIPGLWLQNSATTSILASPLSTIIKYADGMPYTTASARCLNIEPKGFWKAPDSHIFAQNIFTFWMPTNLAKAKAELTRRGVDYADDNNGNFYVFFLCQTSTDGPIQELFNTYSYNKSTGVLNTSPIGGSRVPSQWPSIPVVYGGAGGKLHCISTTVRPGLP